MFGPLGLSSLRCHGTPPDAEGLSPGGALKFDGPVRSYTVGGGDMEFREGILLHHGIDGGVEEVGCIL